MDELFKHALDIMDDNFGHMIEGCLASSANDEVTARDLHCYYKDGKVYVCSKLSSTLVADITVNPKVALCYGTSNMQGVAKILGHPTLPQNAEIRKMLKREMGLNYDEYSVESDIETLLVEITLTKAKTYSRFHCYRIDFVNQTASRDRSVPSFIYR